MDLGEILRVMRSRWYVVVPMLVLAAALGVGAYAMVPTSYSTYTMVSLLSSPMATTTATQGQDNPFLNFNGSLVATADFLGRRLQSTDVKLELEKAGVTEEYEVALAENAQGPFLTLTVTGTDRDHILASAATLARYADTKLVQIQEQNGVAKRDQITLTQVIPPQKPQPEMKKKYELVIAAAGGMVALTFVLTFIVESLARRRRNQAAAAETIEDAGDMPPVIHSGAVPVPPRTAPVVNGKAEVGDETRILHPAPKGAAQVPDKKPAETVVRPDETAIINAPSSLPMRGDGRRPRPDSSVQVPRQAGAPAAENKPRGKAGVPPAAGTPRVGSSTTYQSQSADRRGQDANRVNGS